MSAIDDIIFERKRQILDEGWSAEHDDKYNDCELVAAAISYLLAVGARDMQVDLEEAPGTWPWDHKWWKPKTRRQDLVRAAALVIAEIDRMDRDQK